MPKWLLVQTFYSGLHQSVKISIDATVGGALMGRPIDEAKQLLEEMASNNYHWCGEHSNPKKGERLKVDAFTMFASKVNAFFQKVDRLQTTPQGVPLVVHLGMQVYLKCIGPKALLEASANSANHSKI